MTTLLIDTSGRNAHVTLIQDGNVVEQHQWENSPYVGSQILEHIEAILAQARSSWDAIDRIAVHRGPRQEQLFFSGLRTGITTALMLALAQNKEVVGVFGESFQEILTVLDQAVPQEVISPVYE